jgi:hypothetical protein
MPAIYAVLDKCPVPVGSHLVSSHVKKDNAKFDSQKSYFTDASGNAIAFEAAINLLIKAKDTGVNLSSTKKDQAKIVAVPPKTVCSISADPGKVGFAVTWGDQVGSDSTAASCKWICLFVTSTLTGGRHQWVTAFPATDTYVTSKRTP